MRFVDERLSGAAEISQSPWILIVVPAPQNRRDAMRRLPHPYRVTLTAELRHRVHALLRRGERTIVLDLGRLASIDAAGIGQLVRAYNVSRAATAGFRLANASARLRELLERVGLFDLLSAGPDGVDERG
jgi:anti-anti-sigma factor